MHRRNFRDWMLLTAVLAAGVLPLVLAPLRARILGPSVRGEFAFFQSSFQVVAALSALGIRHAFYQDAGEADSIRRYRIRDFVLVPGTIGISSGLVLALLAFNTMPVFVVTAILGLSILGPLFALTQLQMAKSQFDLDRRQIFAQSGVTPIVEFICNLGLIVGRELTLLSSILATSLSESVRIVISIRSHRRDWSGIVQAFNAVEKRPRHRARLRRFWAAAVRYAPATFVPMFASNIDSLIFGLMLPTKLLGNYAVAKLVTSVFLLGASALETRLFGIIARRGLIRILTVSLIPLAAIAALASVAANLALTPLFGLDYLPARDAIPVTSLAGVFACTFVWSTAWCASSGMSARSLGAAGAVVALMAVGCVFVSLQPAADVPLMAIPLAAAYATGTAIAVIPNPSNPQKEG